MAREQWRFSFNQPSPDVRHEEVGAVLRAKLTTQGGAYSPTNARYDYLTLNHFADMSGSDWNGRDAVQRRRVLHADRQQQRDDAGHRDAAALGARREGRSVRTTRSSTRPGDSFLRQRFALQSHGPYDQPRAMRFALEHQNPLVGGTVSGGTAYPATSHSFLSISDPNVLLWSLKPAEEGIGEGVIARVWNLTGTPKPFSISLRASRSRAPSPSRTSRRIGATRPSPPAASPRPPRRTSSSRSGSSPLLFPVP